MRPGGDASGYGPGADVLISQLPPLAEGTTSGNCVIGVEQAFPDTTAGSSSSAGRSLCTGPGCT